MHSTPPALYRGRSGTGRKVGVYLSRCAPDAVRTSRYTGRAPRPIRWALSLSSCPAVSRCPVDSAYYSAGCCPCQQFFEKNISAVFFKDNENARARRSSQNRRKQVKTGVLSAEKFFEKIRKTRKKDFSRRAARLFFEIFALSRPAYTVPAPLSRRSVPPCHALCPADHQKTTRQHYVKKITYERLFIYPTLGVKIGVLTPQKIGLLQKSTFRVYYKTAFRHFSAV